MSSNNIFEDVLNDAKGVEEKILGPTYPSYKNIKTPEQLGMSDKGTLQQMGKDIDGLVQYVELLVTGNSNASVTGKPLGNKFFLQTGAKCVAVDTCSDPNDTTGSSCKQVDRYVYIDNVPEGNVPIISSGLGVNFSEFKGLIPGAMSNLNVLNPFNIMRAFLAGSVPTCQSITMQTINNDNVVNSESHYVALYDINSMDPCSFSNKTNPLTGQKCSESFSNYSDNNYNDNNYNDISLPDDILSQIYLAGLSGIGVYMLYKLMNKNI